MFHIINYEFIKKKKKILFHSSSNNQWKILMSLYVVEISEDIFQCELFNELIKNT